jgi:TctA family transporter
MNVFSTRIGEFHRDCRPPGLRPVNLAVLFGSVLLGIMFGAMPGLTSTLGVALLTA